MALIQWSLDWIWMALSVVFSGKLDVQEIILRKVSAEHDDDVIVVARKVSNFIW